MNEKCDVLVDARGLDCPLPLLKAKQALNRMVSGQLLEICATDAGSVRDFAVFSTQSGHRLLCSEELNGEYRYIIKKS
ncbi:MAG: tRNA 2-thiouridine synthesizing protein A [Bermanella sp.]|jgi:tRNA 2-thiouridine synthesizing protein A